MKQNSKAFKTILGLAVLFGCFGACVFSNSSVSKTLVNATSESHFHDNITFEPWNSNNSLPTSGSYYLTNDIEISYSKYSEYASVLDGDLNLCLNGHLIKMTYSSDWKGPSTFYVGSDRTLKLFDCNESEETTHYYRTSNENDWALSSYSASAISLEEVTLNTPNGTIVKIPGGAIVDSCNNSSRREPCKYDNPYGGAVKVDGTNARFYMYGGNIIGNYCNYGGGGVAIEHGAYFEMNGGRIIGNDGYEAGGVYSRNNTCNLTINDGLIAFNIARNTYGGGIATLGPITMNGGSIIGNRTKTDSDDQTRSGGGVYVNGSTFTMNSGIISYNYARKDGGGVYVENGSFYMHSGEIDYNSAGQYGGGLRSTSTAFFEIDGGSVSHNISTNTGGGICSNGRFKIVDAIINYNSSGADGGGIHTWGDSGRPITSDNPSIISGNTSISYNTCTKEGGGIHHCNGSSQHNLVISGNVLISNNKSSGNGGGIICKGVLTMNGGTIADNTGGNSGGGVAINSGFTFTLNDGCIKNNSSIMWGGGVIAEQSATFIMNGGTIINNKTSESNKGGGALRTGGATTINGGYIAKNTSPLGSGMYKAEGSLNIKKGRFSTENSYHSCTVSGTSTITLDRNDGSGDFTTINNQSWGVNLPSLSSLGILILARDGYTFEGYYNAPVGGDNYYNADGTPATRNGDGIKWDYIGPVTLYAHWVADSHLVALDFQGGTGGTSTVTATFDASMPEITLPIRAYCTFEGYYTGENGAGIQYYNADGTSTRNWDIDSNVTLYAKWSITLESFAHQFIDLTFSYCSGDKSFIDTLKASFKLLSTEDVEAFIDAPIIVGKGQIYEVEGYSSKVIEAKSRYYNMITERGFDQFIEGINIPPISKSLFNTTSFLGIEEEGIPQVSTAVVLVALGGFSVGAYFLLKKKKFN